MTLLRRRCPTQCTSTSSNHHLLPARRAMGHTAKAAIREKSLRNPIFVREACPVGRGMIATGNPPALCLEWTGCP